MEKINNREKRKKLLSIIIPFHNRTDLLIKTINSIKPHINSNHEIILIDDGSSIDPYSELKKYLNTNIHYHKIINSERGFARNYGASKAIGMYVNFFDSDDIALSNHITSFESYIKKNNFPNIFTNSYKVRNIRYNYDKNIVVNKKLYKNIFKHNLISCNAVFLKKEFFNKYKFSEDKLLSGSEDWDLWLRISCDKKIKVNPIISSVLIDHNLRSTKIQKTDKMISRIDTLYKRIINKNIINLDQELSNVLSEIYSFKSMIYSQIVKKKIISFLFLIYSLYLRPTRIIEKRTYAILRNIFLKFT